MKRNVDISPGSSSSSTKQDKKRKKIYITQSRNQKKSKEKANFLNSIPLPLTNKFASLDEKMEDDATTNAHGTTKNKIAPIVITDFETDIQSMLTALELSEQCDIKLVSVGRNFFAKSIEDKQKIVEKLKSDEINFSHIRIPNKKFSKLLVCQKLKLVI